MTEIALHQYAEEEFAIHNREAFDAFVDYLLDGINTQRAFVRLFGDDQQSHTKCELMLHNPYVQRELARKTAELKPQEAWTVNHSIVEYKRMMKDIYEKGSVRLQAHKELNVLMGITEVDDAGRTRKVPTMEDMYGGPPESEGDQG